MGGVAVTLLLVATGCSPAAPTAAPTPAPAPPLRPRVLIFGDSYTQGWGAETPRAGYAYRVGDPLGWDVTVDGVGGTGYVNPGRDQQGTYRTRLARAHSGPFDVVVLQGSTNDARSAPASLPAAVAQTVDAVGERYPEARLLMLGPAALYGRPTEELSRVQHVLSDYARENDVPFVDPIAEGWFQPGDAATCANPANGHPNDEGYARIADRFVQHVQQLPQLTG